ncbi:hypothetical protein PYW08_015250 [Mythimna loreyi]|uniref:Uncharacterized protein n=1 Tax=Mythimna loreyi TaxID=667449 RepID=A0ACC2QW52_9NEOP|nr:hypothetical protein PYW08_015250 [Mythimna loreyi]
MALVENIPPPNADSEMEEGEIVDDLSDISSEEEFLLRQRLQVLENYNNVLERKKAKRSSVGPGTKHKEDTLLYDLSEISATELDDYSSHATHRPKSQKRQKTHHRQKRKKVEPIVHPLRTKSLYLTTKDYKKKTPHSKKKLAVKIVSESSEESEDEYRNRRRKLADAVVLNKNTYKNDKTSLSERLQKMLCGVNPEPTKVFLTENKMSKDIDKLLEQSKLSFISSLTGDDHKIFNAETEISLPKQAQSCELIDLCTDEDSKTVPMDLQQDTVDSVSKDIKKDEDLKKDSCRENMSDKDSDEDLELLRQHALKTKTTKANAVTNDVQTENKILSEDEDSDTAELRLICLKSALLKKAIERKQKQKFMKKRLSQSTNFPNDLIQSDNNTDIESVDMDMGSDADDKAKENLDASAKLNTINEQNISEINKALEKDIPAINLPNEDELEDDEDLLRAKLLTSLSKNLPNLVNPKVVDSADSIKDTRPISPKTLQPPPVPAKPAVIPEEKRLIITVGESDSEGEHEATKNLTKMHLKLSEQIDFQQKLDIFLKSTRMEVEKTKLPDVVQQPDPPKKNEKFVAKAVNHLPKSEQMEYKNLVKRMAELEKIKQARQTTFNLSTKVSAPLKDTLKPRNVAVDSSKLSAINDLEEKIQMSRKNIAEESAKMLKLKEEGVKLSQKYKIVATELRNIKTAIALNKKQTRSVQNCLTKIRLHHQMLLKSSMNSSHSKINGTLPLNRVLPRLQKENNPANEEHKTLPVVNRIVKIAAKENNLVREEPRNVIVHKIVKENNNLGKEDPNIAVVHKSAKENNPASETEIPLPNNVGVASQEPLEKSPPILSIRLDVTSNKKVVKIAGDKIDINDKSKLNVELKDRNEDLLENERLASHPIVEKGGGKEVAAAVRTRLETDDYRSPLEAFGISTWEGDPNAILCPFEVGGDCKDADCIYLHTQPRST